MTELALFDHPIAAADPAGEPAWVKDRRAAAREAFHTGGLPGAKTEAWKYTSLNRLRGVPFVPRAGQPIDVAALAGAPTIAGARRLVFVNGAFAPALSDRAADETGVRALPLARALTEPTLAALIEPVLGRLVDPRELPLAALNGSLFGDGYVIVLDPGAAPTRPLHVLSVVAGAAPLAAPRNLIVAGAGSRAVVVETQLGTADDASLLTAVTEAAVAPGARLAYYKVAALGPDAVHVGTLGARLDPGAALEVFLLTLSGGLVRNEVRIELAGPEASARLDGAYLVDGRSVADTTTLIDHAGPGASSRQTIRGVLTGQGRGVYQGKVLVRRDAQKTDGHQLHRALLLAPGAEVDAKPELEIYADDVKCGHGATVSRIDPLARFYLESRGIPRPLARRLLVEAFLAESIEAIGEASVREAFGDLLRTRLESLRIPEEATP